MLTERRGSARPCDYVQTQGQGEDTSFITIFDRKTLDPFKTLPSGRKEQTYSKEGGKRKQPHQQQKLQQQQQQQQQGQQITTTGVMHNLPVLWLVVGPLAVCHAPVSIVGQLEVALLLCVGHAVQCAVSVPGL